MSAPNPQNAVSNSFDYTPVRYLDGFVPNADCCPARDLQLSVVNSSRLVIVDTTGMTGCSQAGRAVLCKTATGDFSDADVRFVVHDRGQLYCDRSGKPAINDFATDVQQLVLSLECRRCPDFRTCCCCYVPAARSYFSDDERWLAGRMEQLSGRVLDVGLGNVPYLKWAGVIDEYHGVDPDPDAGASVADNVILHNVTIEKFSGFDGYFDWVLSLRSLNHFLDVSDALASVYLCLKPGGRAIFIESLALPLLRSPRQARECHDGAVGGFQHLRNWDSAQLVDVALKAGFEVTYHRPISFDTTDQWLVILTKS